MKKLWICAFLALSSASYASQINVMGVAWIMNAGEAKVIPLSSTMSMHVVDLGDPNLSVFDTKIVRSEGGISQTVCEYQVHVPFGSETTIRFVDPEIIIKFIASATPEGTVS